MNSQLKVKKRKQEGDLAHEYRPLWNMVDKDDNIVDFKTTEISMDLNHPADMEIQPSYDGTANIIINDDLNPPRIVNTRWSKLEDNRYKIINRNQLQQTNLYEQGKVDSQTRLFRNVNMIPKIGLNRVNYYGQLKGGNYTFYVKFADNDYNKTDIVCESGIISIYKGTFSDVPSISGTLSDERTDKAIQLTISNIDTSFSRVYLYYTRDTSDMRGFRISETCMVTKPYEIKSNTLTISLNGFEEVETINDEEINIKYNLVTAVKTQTQVQNMLFFGNVQGVNINYKDLQNISLYINVGLRKTASNESLGYVDHNYKGLYNNDINQNEYYNPLNIYYKLGYWPGEIYRLGIVYQMADDSLSPVFNLRGHKFNKAAKYENGQWRDEEFNYSSSSPYAELMNKDDPDKPVMNYIPTDEFILEDAYLDNTKGVFRNPDDFSVVQHDGERGVYPLYYEISLNDDVREQLRINGVKGFFIVRQKRIPITLAQGLSIGTDKISFTPMLYDDQQINPTSNVAKGYIGESFISSPKSMTGERSIGSGLMLTTDYLSRRITTDYKQSSGLLSLDACVNPSLQSVLDGTQYTFQPVWKANVGRDNRRYYLGKYLPVDTSYFQKTSAVYVNSDVPLKYVNGIGFSTRAGMAEDVKGVAFFGQRDYAKITNKLIRGVFCPFVGLTGALQDNHIYNLRIQNYSSVFEKEYFQIRTNDNSSFFAVTDRYELSNPQPIKVYRGDCFTNTVTLRLQRNFVDSDTPVNENIVKPDTWKENYKGYMETTAEDWLNINRSDVNAVPMGTWVTFKCLSNYNLGLRSVDSTNTDEMAIMGSARDFFPHSSTSVSTGKKMEESWLYNDGYSASVGHKRNLAAPDVPYIKDLFDNRIMFSNVQVDDDFRNAYRIFQGLSFKDIDRQYGAIVKLIPWGVNLFCVFEHGLALIPINEKALMATATGQSIHMYGAGVIQNQVSLITPDFGSIWPESVIRTPVGIYGVDTYAKKIWRFSDKGGLELLSDTKIQRYLNDNIKLAEKDKYPVVALKNIKSHFNNYKGDVMFTFYNDDEGSEWNLCFNERLDKWITRYSWTPLYSENINNVFYSLDKKRAEVLSYIYGNRNTNVGLNIENNQITPHSDFDTSFTMKGYDFFKRFEFKINSVRSSYLEEDPSNFVNVTFMFEDRIRVVKVRKGLDIVLPDPETFGFVVPEGYVFDGWLLNGSITTEIVTHVDITLIGKLSPILETI